MSTNMGVAVNAFPEWDMDDLDFLVDRNLHLLSFLKSGKPHLAYYLCYPGTLGAREGKGLPPEATKELRRRSDPAVRRYYPVRFLR